MHPHTCLRTQIRNVLRKWFFKSRKHSIIHTHFPKDQNCEVCLRTKIYKGSLQKTHWRSITSSRKVWWLDNGWSQGPQWGGWITKQSLVRCRCSRSCRSMDSILSVQNKDFTRDGKEFAKVSRAVAKNKSYFFGQFIGIWKILWRSIMDSNLNTSSIRDRWHCWESRTKNKRRNLSSFEKWWADSMECYCYLRNVQDLPHERRFGEPFKRPIIPFGALIEYLQISTRHQSRVHQFGEKVLPGIFLGYELIAERIWKGDIAIADLEDLEKLDASEIYLWRINAREVFISQKGDEFVFPVADGTAKLSGRDYDFGQPTLRREHTERSEDFSRELQGEPGESQPTASTDDAEARADFCSKKGDFIYRHHNEPRVQFYLPME